MPRPSKSTKRIRFARILVLKDPTYFPIQKNWRKLGPLFRSAESKAIWLPCLKEYQLQKAHEHGFKVKFDRDYECPAQFDGCDWRFDRNGKPGPSPAFWDFVCHAACHWVVDMCCYVARKAYPEVPWQIVTHHDHSTVWNGDKKNPVLFDVNYLALGVTAKEAWQRASKGRIMKHGSWLKPYNIPYDIQRTMRVKKG